MLQGARALIVTSVEEFGIAAVESQAAGRPVIARAGGGALETVIDGVTGCFWSGRPDELAHAVLEFDDAAVDPEACVRTTRRGSTARPSAASSCAQVEAAIATGLAPAAATASRCIDRALVQPRGAATADGR